MENSLAMWEGNNLPSPWLRMFVRTKTRDTSLPTDWVRAPEEKKTEKVVEVKREEEPKPLDLNYLSGAMGFGIEPPAPFVYQERVPFTFEVMKPSFYDYADEGIKYICKEVFEREKDWVETCGIMSKDGTVEAQKYVEYWHMIRWKVIKEIGEEYKKGCGFFNKKSSMNSLRNRLLSVLNPKEANIWTNIVFNPLDGKD